MPLFRPAKPKMKLRLSADVVLAAGQQTVPLNQVIWSEGDIALLGGGVVQVNRPGLLLVQGSVGRAAVVTSAAVQVKFLLNGLQAADTITVLPAATTSSTTVQVCELIPVVSGDTLELATTLSGTAAATCRRIGTAMSIVRIGPERWT